MHAIETARLVSDLIEELLVSTPLQSPSSESTAQKEVSRRIHESPISKGTEVLPFYTWRPKGRVRTSEKQRFLSSQRPRANVHRDGAMMECFSAIRSRSCEVWFKHEASPPQQLPKLQKHGSPHLLTHRHSQKKQKANRRSARYFHPNSTGV